MISLLLAHGRCPTTSQLTPQAGTSAYGDSAAAEAAGLEAMAEPADMAAMAEEEEPGEPAGQAAPAAPVELAAQVLGIILAPIEVWLWGAVVPEAEDPEREVRRATAVTSEAMGRQAASEAGAPAELWGAQAAGTWLVIFPQLHLVC